MNAKNIIKLLAIIVLIFIVGYITLNGLNVGVIGLNLWRKHQFRLDLPGYLCLLENNRKGQSTNYKWENNWYYWVIRGRIDD